MRQFFFSFISSWIRNFVLIKYSYRCYALEAIRYKYVDHVYMFNLVHKRPACMRVHQSLVLALKFAHACSYDSLHTLMPLMDENKSKAGFGNGRQSNMKRLHSYVYI